MQGMIELTTHTYEEGMRIVQEHEKWRVQCGIRNLLLICQPGTDMEVTIDIPGTEREVITVTMICLMGQHSLDESQEGESK